MKVTVVPYSPGWPAAFRRESARVREALGAPLDALHHIGSTSIPGLHAKPVIDMLAEVDDLDAVDARNASMVGLGYEPMGELGIPGRRYFRREVDGERTHHVHAFLAGSPEVTRHLAFRDYVIAHPTVAEEYGALKVRLAAAHPDDIERYMDGKDDFIKRTERAALAWRSTRGPA